MLSSTTHQASLFYVAFAREAALIKDDLLEPIDALLDDSALVDLVREAQAKRSPRSRTMGRQTVAPDRLLRCCVLKHVKNWSFRQLERELRASLVYRHFTRFDEHPIPNFSTFSRSFALLDPAVTEQIHAHVVATARQQRVAPGHKLRTDTTVVESNVHYPTDSTLLQDGIRVLTRSLKRISQECSAGAVRITDHARSVQRRVLEIHRAAKSFTDGGRDRMKESYARLMGLARGVVRTAERVTEELEMGKLPIPGSFVRVMLNEAQLRHFTPLVKKVLVQTKARVFGGDRHVQGKVLSLFEEHTQAICKGKAHKPTEFGRLVRVDEVENGIVSAYEVQDGNPADATAWVPALERHERLFGRAPKRATADRGFFSAENEREAKTRGVKQVALPARGRLSNPARHCRSRAGSGGCCAGAAVSSLASPTSSTGSAWSVRSTKGTPASSASSAGASSARIWSPWRGSSRAGGRDKRMTPKANAQHDRRTELLAEIGRLAEVAIFGTLSETYRRCGSVGCHCQGRGPKHGPHLNVSYRSAAGKTTGYYVPKAAQEKIRAGVAAWQTLQERLRELAELTKEQVLQRAKEESREP